MPGGSGAVSGGWGERPGREERGKKARWTWLFGGANFGVCVIGNLELGLLPPPVAVSGRGRWHRDQVSMGETDTTD